ncbi:hypothetical protein DPM13_01390 [Paracoccus mutanolyticus]|uniref:Uncharacterized protein n=1 Tax=Paracoccus mutanolyticus TaxID=1499308 RepID=A0ABN5M4D0_9RHOB|nr:hypothetical protein [Paracoccus mutanolyticus]AWX92357.1 hypothetical protein DPM13_01390 [Paracoccus mutanolyticus]
MRFVSGPWKVIRADAKSRRYHRLTDPGVLDAEGKLIGGNNMAAVHLAHAVGGNTSCAGHPRRRVASSGRRRSRRWSTRGTELVPAVLSSQPSPSLHGSISARRLRDLPLVNAVARADTDAPADG